MGNPLDAIEEFLEAARNSPDQLDRLQELLTEQYAAWRTNPAINRDDPTMEFVAQLAQHLIALVAIQQGLRDRELRRARLT